MYNEENNNYFQRQDNNESNFNNNFKNEEEKSSWKEKLKKINFKKNKNDSTIELTRSKAQKLLIRAVLWALVSVLSLAFGINSIVQGSENIINITNAFNDDHIWKGIVKLLYSLANFIEAMLFIFFIGYSFVKFMFYFSPYWNWKKSLENTSNNKKQLKKESKKRKAKERKLKKEERQNKF